jgi:hypothetical protein
MFDAPQLGLIIRAAAGLAKSGSEALAGGWNTAGIPATPWPILIVAFARLDRVPAENDHHGPCMALMAGGRNAPFLYFQF